MRPAALLDNETFAGNRAQGRIALAVDCARGATGRTRVHEAGALRVRFPRSDRANSLDAVIVNTAGGMAGGDRFNIEVTVGEGSDLVVTTAAAEKVYRALGSDTDIDVKLNVAKGATLAWLPQETILFNQVRLRRSIDIDLARGANFLLAEAVIFGRSAMGETVREGRFRDFWRVRIDGALVYGENTVIDGAIANTLAKPAVTKNAIAIASVLKIPGGDDDVAAVRAVTEKCGGEVGASAWNGHAVVRFVAADGAVLRRDLVTVLAALRTTPLPRLWLN